MIEDKKINKIEILAPAGGPEAVTAAVANGADAVYFGAPSFNARIYAKNFTIDEFATAVKYCKQKGVKTYITLNTLVTDREIKEALRIADFACQLGANGLIIQDLGLSQIIRRNLPQIELHASTQMAVYNLAGAIEIKELGFSRVVLARELSKENIEYITKNCGIETEVFVHGALCYSYSGMCLMSSVIGRRSGNRGRCAQPCRLPYSINGKTGCILSLKDLAMIDEVKSLSKMGVASLKIEGRMKRPEYVGAVTRAYKNAVYSSKNIKEDNIRLSKIFSRSGFTKGYYISDKGPHMLGVRSDDREGEYARLLEEERRIYKRDYDFFLKSIEPIEINTDIDVNNAVKTELQGNFKKPDKTKIYAFYNSVLQMGKGVDLTDKCFLPAKELIKLRNTSSEKLGVIFPRIVPDHEYENLKKILQSIHDKGVKTAYIENIGHFKLAREIGFKIITGIGMNGFNSISIKELNKMGAERVTVSVENSFPQIRDIKPFCELGLFAYGRIPLMITENCVLKNSGNCSKKGCGEAILSDRRNERFLVLAEEGCRNIIYNSKVLYLADKLNEIKKLPISFIGLYFTDENKIKCDKIIKEYITGKGTPPKDFTRGLYNKGVE